MVRRNIQFGKIIFVVLDLRAFYDLIAHSDEDPLQFFQGDGVRMAVAYVVLLRRQGHVDDFPPHLLLTGLLRQRGARLLQLRLDSGACVVDHLADLRALLRRNILHALQDAGQFALLAQICHPDLI